MRVSVLYTGTLLWRNMVLKSTAKMYNLAGAVQCVGTVEEHVIEQRSQKIDISTHTASKAKC